MINSNPFLFKSDEEFYKYRTGALPAANPRFFKSSSNIPSSIRAALSNPRIPKSKGNN